MSHGGENPTRASENNNNCNIRASDEFSRAVVRIAVAQICEGIGFQGTKESALDSLAEIAIRYLCDLGKTSTLCANLTGRAESNVFDVIRALELLEVSQQGFPGAAEAGRRCLAGSGVVKELSRFVEVAEEIPFAQSIAKFPVLGGRRSSSSPVPSFFVIGEDPPGTHIPAWLPALPDPHTYLRSPTWNERKTDPREDKIEQIRQRRKAERSLFSLQQRLVGTENETRTKTADEKIETEAGNGKNPFLEQPFRAGEKEVSEVAVLLPRPPLKPEKKRVVVIDDEEEAGEEEEQGSAVLRAFGPAIEAAKKNVELCEDDERQALLTDEPEESERQVKPARPSVNFKLRSAAAKKKFLVEPPDLDLCNLRQNEAGFWFARDEERDDKKRRAEFILRQSIDNPQELNQM